MSDYCQHIVTPWSVIVGSAPVSTFEHTFTPSSASVDRPIRRHVILFYLQPSQALRNLPSLKRTQEYKFTYSSLVHVYYRARTPDHLPYNSCGRPLKCFQRHAVPEYAPSSVLGAIVINLFCLLIGRAKKVFGHLTFLQNTAWMDVILVTGQKGCNSNSLLVKNIEKVSGKKKPQSTLSSWELRLTQVGEYRSIFAPFFSSSVRYELSYSIMPLLPVVTPVSSWSNKYIMADTASYSFFQTVPTLWLSDCSHTLLTGCEWIKRLLFKIFVQRAVVAILHKLTHDVRGILMSTVSRKKITMHYIYTK